MWFPLSLLRPKAGLKMSGLNILCLGFSDILIRCPDLRCANWLIPLTNPDCFTDPFFKKPPRHLAAIWHAQIQQMKLSTGFPYWETFFLLNSACQANVRLFTRLPILVLYWVRGGGGGRIL